MPESRNRPKHYQHLHHKAAPSHNAPARVRRSAAFVVGMLAAVLGLAVAYFTQGSDIFWMIAGTASGAIIGYFVGRNMDKSIEKR